MAGIRVVIAVAGLLVAVAGLSEAAEPDGQYITRWLVAGPLDGAVSTEAILGFVGGTNVRPREGETLRGCGGRWTPYCGEGSIVNLREITGFGRDIAAVAYGEILSDSDTKGRLYCATQNDVHLWLNGNLAGERPEHNDDTLAPWSCDVALRQGINTCLIVCKTSSSRLFGFTFRADGPRTTPAPPLVWNPLSVTQEDGRYALLSPDWRWRQGDDLVWAKPDYDDSDWQRLPPNGALDLKEGARYWMRVRGQFTQDSSLLPFVLGCTNEHGAEVYADGVLVDAMGKLGVALDLFRSWCPTVRLPKACVIAIRVIAEDSGHPVLPVLRRTDLRMREILDAKVLQSGNRFFLAFCFLSYLLYYVFAYWNHPRWNEGRWYSVVLLLLFLSMLTLEFSKWSDRYAQELAWTGLGLSGLACVCGVAMSQVIARQDVFWPTVLGYGLLAAVLYGCAFAWNERWTALIIMPLTTLEYLRQWLVFEFIPRRPNWRYVGTGLLFFVAGQLLALWCAVVGKPLLMGTCEYAHLYGVLALMASLLDYMSKESGQAVRDLQILTATLEKRVEERTQQVQRLTQRVITAEEDERERLARELHDSVAQTLWFAKMSAENHKADAHRPHSRDIIGYLDKAIGEVRAIAYNLRPPELDKLGLPEAFSHACKEFSYLTKIPLDYQAIGVDNLSLGPVVEVNLYRVLQEALNNIQQHAEASKVRVRLVGTFPSLMLRIEDNGGGYDPSRQGEVSKSMGLRSMEERVRLMGGGMRIQTALGEGVRIVVEVPQKKEQI